MPSREWLSKGPSAEWLEEFGDNKKIEDVEKNRTDIASTSQQQKALQENHDNINWDDVVDATGYAMGFIYGGKHDPLWRETLDQSFCSAEGALYLINEPTHENRPRLAELLLTDTLAGLISSVDRNGRFYYAPRDFLDWAIAKQLPVPDEILRHLKEHDETKELIRKSMDAVEKARAKNNQSNHTISDDFFNDRSYGSEDDLITLIHALAVDYEGWTEEETNKISSLLRNGQASQGITKYNAYAEIAAMFPRYRAEFSATEPSELLGNMPRWPEIPSLKDRVERFVWLEIWRKRRIDGLAEKLSKERILLITQIDMAIYEARRQLDTELTSSLSSLENVAGIMNNDALFPIDEPVDSSDAIVPINDGSEDNKDLKGDSPKQREKFEYPETKEWKIKAREIGQKWMEQQRREGNDPGVIKIAKYVEGELSTLNITGVRGKFLYASTIKREALRGITGNPPNGKSKN